MFRRQSRSFVNSKCVHKEFEFLNFTGRSIKAPYSALSCHLICYQELIWENCQCTYGLSLNDNVSLCLEIEENRKCVNNISYFVKDYERLTSCRSKCVKKCNQKLVKVSPTRENFVYKNDVLLYFLKDLAGNEYASSPLARRLLDEIDQSENRVEKVEAISRQVAQCSVYVKANEPITNIDVIEMVSFSTFLSNIGGLLGMWLGLSVMSLFTLSQKCLEKCCWGRKLENGKKSNFANISN